MPFKLVIRGFMKETIEKHWSADASSYNKSIQKALYSEETKKPWKEIFTQVLGKDSLNLLDVGTGPGIVAFLLAELGHCVTGVDFSEEMLSNARRNNKALGLNVDFRKGDAENLPFADEAFDAVVSRYVLWTVPDPKKAIREWKRVLKPGGMVIIIDGNWYGNRTTLKRRIWHELSLLLILITEHRNPYTHEFGPELKKGLWCIETKRPDADRKLLEQNGFKDIYVKDKINQRTQTMIEHLKYGYQGDAFLITAIKS
jgi:ubiquinone/menaquinone biosynthesis C-methylase UbiE